MKPRTPVKRASAKWLAKNPDLARAGRTVRSSPVQRSPQQTRKAWRMCRTCHRKVCTPFGSCSHEKHSVEPVGECGQCGKRRPLVTCHGYDFRVSRKTKPRVRNTKRTKKNFDRSYGEKAAWIRLQDCAVCGYHAPSEPAHTKGDGGAGRKSSAKYLVPLCGSRIVGETSPLSPRGRRPIMDEGCHRLSHRIGVKSFEAQYGVSLVALAAEYHERWLSSVAGGA